MSENTQDYVVNIQFKFTGQVFPEDPDDIYQLAQLEQESMLVNIDQHLENLVGSMPYDIEVAVEPDLTA